MDTNLLVGLAPLLLVVALDAWVFADARGRQGTSREVSARIWSLEVNSPQAWLAWCALVFVVFFPLYLIAREARD